MNQNDYRRYGQVPPQQGSNFRNPYQQQMMPPPQGYAPQPPQMMPQGGNFAPRPPQMPPQQMQPGMYQGQPYVQNGQPMTEFDQMYSKNGQGWKSIRLDNGQQFTDEDAQREVDAMDSMMNAINGNIDTTVAHSGNVQQVVTAMKYIINSLREPETWVPTDQKGQVPAIKTSGSKIAKVLEVFTGELAKLNGKK